MATPVFCCGAECGVNGSVGQHWVFTGTASFSTGTVRNGARSIRTNPTAAGGQAEIIALSSSNKWVVKVAVRFATLPSIDLPIMFLPNTGNGVMFKQSDSKIYAGAIPSGTVLFGATGAAVTTGVWYVIDLKVDESANPHLVDVQVDTTACAQYSQAVAANADTALRITANGLSGTWDLFVDDLVVSHTLADYPFGDGYVNHFVPISDGTHNVAGRGRLHAWHGWC
jgi:hypothetical protein